MEDIRNEPNPGTEKYDIGYINEFYWQILNPRKYSVKNVLEIGIMQGASLELWRNFFPNAEVVGVDINAPIRVFNRERITTIKADAYNAFFVSLIANKFYDLIVDDGPHTFNSMVSFLTLYPPLLAPGGVMVLEDIIDISWTPRLVALLDKEKYSVRVVHTAGKQLTTHFLNLWSKGLDVIIVEKR
jgi:cephalosporin hydroxylase